LGTIFKEGLEFYQSQTYCCGDQFYEGILTK